jgi:hypothetical protein
MLMKHFKILSNMKILFLFWTVIYISLVKIILEADVYRTYVTYMKT